MTKGTLTTHLILLFWKALPSTLKLYTTIKLLCTVSPASSNVYAIIHLSELNQLDKYNMER